MEALASQSDAQSSVSAREERRKDSFKRSQRHTKIAWPAAETSLRLEEGPVNFFRLWDFSMCVPGRVSLRNWAFSLFVVWRTLVDMWSDEDTNRRRKTCAQKCLRWRIWGVFYASLLQGRWLWLLFAVGGFRSICLNHFCKKQKARSQKTDRACWSKKKKKKLMTTLSVQEKNLPTHTKWSATRK